MRAKPIRFSPAEISAYYRRRVPDLKQRGQEWRGPCPVHRGEDANFTVNSQTGAWYCHSQCGRGGGILTLEEELNNSDFNTAREEVFRIVGRGSRSRNVGQEAVHPGDPDWNRFEKPLARATENFARRKGLCHVRNYRYRYEDGRLAYVKARFVNPDGEKTFQQYAPGKNGEVTTPRKAGIPPLLYNLDSLAGAEEIHLCNGEKAANAARKLALVTTCLPDGEGHWDRRFTQHFKNKRIIVYLDNDEKGQAHGSIVSRALFGHAAEIRLVRFPNVPPKGDLYDWIKAGGTADDLRQIIEVTPVVDAIPSGPDAARFRVTSDGVFFVGTDQHDQEPLKICGPLEVAAFTRDATGDAWGRLLKWADAESRKHEWAMPMSLLSGDGSEIRARLLDGGLYIAPVRKARELLQEYIQTTQPRAWLLCASQIGWYGEKFVLPGVTIGPKEGEEVLFQTPYQSEHLLDVAGSLEDWKKNVGRLCAGNSRLIFAASCAFAGPVLALVGAESGGVHFVGATSTGKTTALIVGGSVLGGGGRNGFVQSWRTTANGLEAIAESHNDLTLFLDELAQVDAREASDTAYLLANGSGKQRMNRAISARRKLTWRLIFVSAGEITLSDHAQTAGRRIRAGAEVRLLNIDADAGAGMGIFEHTHGTASADAFARKLKSRALRYYGTPLRA